jgi:RNA polymerase sigma-70 factor (ECF subfamily)
MEPLAPIHDGAFSENGYERSGLLSLKDIMADLLPVASGVAQPEHPQDMAPLVEHLDAAYNLARWLIGNETEAEDAVQEAYLRAISHYKSFWGGDGRAWLLKIVRNTCYDHLKRKNTRGWTTDFNEAEHSVDRQVPDPEAALLLAERSELLASSLAALPPEFREILVLRELEQLSYRQIADIGDIPLGTVMSRLNRARQRLQQTILSRNGVKGH